MSNANKQKYPGKRQKRRNSSTATGIGLILFGAAFFLWLLGSSGKASLPTADEISIVPAEVNFPAPQLALENLNGEKQTLEDYQGRIVLVNNWATWCPPCKAEMPILKQYHDTHAAEGFTVIAVEAGDAKDTVAEFAKSLGLPFPVWLDPESASINAIHNGSLPNSYVIDRTGTVRYAWTGEVTMTMLEKYITPLIAENN
ncbi:MAG TPA: TlpA disulfide reductase family protein [Anaerolineales bacterium]|nr:TlpA disulfide reductase family protein [Anaerolineales bacterium]HNA53474.1 TlpA disulfide reductase family protein [Anaerolineales bacterium]HNH06020.1 TlpA disulfide reductase family protein [Anaerolineales bacterium]